MSEFLKSLITRFNAKLRGASPLQIVGTTVAVMILLRKLRHFLRSRYLETFRQRLGRTILKLAPIRSQYVKENYKDVKQRRIKTREIWARYGKCITELPEDGWSADSLKQMFEQLTAIINNPLTKKQYSGMIYSDSLTEPVDGKLDWDKFEPVLEQRDLQTHEDLSKLSASLKDLYTFAFQRTYLWNQLHGNEFGVGDWLSYQIVQMVAGLFGGDKDEIGGFVTSGGTESLMCAMRCYREWGRATHGHLPGEAVIITAESVHAAVNKAGAAYDMQVVMIPTDRNGHMDVKQMRAAVAKYGNRVVCIVGSAPQYPAGCIDPISDLAKIAVEFNTHLHVDCCLGGFIVNNLDEHKTDFLSIPGVCSLSTDTHKNGWAPKGSSVIAMRNTTHPVFGTVNLAHYSYYTFPFWSGGAYGTPKDSGSISCVHLVHAYIALLHIGKRGYRQIAQAVNRTASKIGELLAVHKELEVFEQPDANVISFRIHPASGWPANACYALAHHFEHEGFVFSACADKYLHFCVTGRLAMNDLAMGEFQTALGKVMEATAADVKEVLDGKASFPGDGGIYGMLEAAKNPAKGDQPLSKSLELWLLGEAGASDAIRAYFTAINNPYGTHKSEM